MGNAGARNSTDSGESGASGTAVPRNSTDARASGTIILAGPRKISTESKASATAVMTQESTFTDAEEPPDEWEPLLPEKMEYVESVDTVMNWVDEKASEPPFGYGLEVGWC